MTTQPSRAAKQGGGCFSRLLNLLTFLILLIGLLLLAGVVLLFAAPDVVQPLLGVQLFGQREGNEGGEITAVVPTTAAIAILPTSTATSPVALSQLQPTWTPQAVTVNNESDPLYTPPPSRTPTAIPIFPTNTPTSTPTPTPTNTPTATPVGPTPTSSPTRAPFPFTKSDTSPFYLQNYANNAGCNWLGIAGEVLDINRNPVPKSTYQVHIWDSGLNERVPVGGAPAYSPSGWEQFVFSSPVVRSYKVQLETSNGTPVSEVYTVTTRASCNENLLRFDFVQNH